MWLLEDFPAKLWKSEKFSQIEFKQKLMIIRLGIRRFSNMKWMENIVVLQK